MSNPRDKMPEGFQPRTGAGWTGPGDAVIGGVTGSGTPDAVSVEKQNAETVMMTKDTAVADVLGDILEQLKLLTEMLT